MCYKRRLSARWLPLNGTWASFSHEILTCATLMLLLNKSFRLCTAYLDSQIKCDLSHFWKCSDRRGLNSLGLSQVTAWFVWIPYRVVIKLGSGFRSVSSVDPYLFASFDSPAAEDRKSVWGVRDVSLCLALIQRLRFKPYAGLKKCLHPSLWLSADQDTVLNSSVSSSVTIKQWCSHQPVQMGTLK